MRLRFWRWAHDAAERLWHWIYYNRIPEGIAERKRSEARFSAAANLFNEAYRYSLKYMTANGKEFDPSPEQAEDNRVRNG